MEKINILVVDDKDYVSEPIAETLRRKGYDVKTASSGPSAITLFRGERFDLVISDFKMQPMNGVELLENIKQINPEVPFLIFTGFGDIKTAVEAMERGAFTFLEKDDTLIQKIEVMVGRALEHRSLIVENKSLVNENKQLISELRDKWDYVGSAPKLMEIRKFTETVANSRSTVLITGESGTGKEVIARWIHYHSPRKPGPFIKINCAALPEGLIESELFGHEKGAFTGAIKNKIGKFEAAHYGTLLLDEISEMPMIAQAKLLRAIQEREVQRVGGDDPVQVDVRILATSNRDLEEEIKNGRFREDLFYRLNVFHVELPPLRERKEDVMALAAHFIEKYNDEDGLDVKGLAPGCDKPLLAHNWPGNIRELENAMQRAVVMTGSGLIKPAIFDFLSERTRTVKPHSSSGDSGLEAGITIAEAEKELIIKTLDHCAQNRTKAAEMLDISTRTLRNKLKEYALGTSDDEDDC
ncbi:MAG: sigma-54 dependent transcriptional regulator [Chitinispirillales bacterium]|jgi:two-component system response regulator AtoC|nr:sigma-54 dependent transcriptional regulator [Chitinispirillales bacterium]